MKPRFFDIHRSRNPAAADNLAPKRNQRKHKRARMRTRRAFRRFFIWEMMMMGGCTLREARYRYRRHWHDEDERRRYGTPA